MRKQQLENEERLASDQIVVGQLLRLNYFHQYNRYVRSDIPRDFMAIVLEQPQPDTWAVLIGYEIQTLQWDPDNSLWLLSSTVEEGPKQWDIDGVYGEVAHA